MHFPVSSPKRFTCLLHMDCRMPFRADEMRTFAKNVLLFRGLSQKTQIRTNDAIAKHISVHTLKRLFVKKNQTEPNYITNDKNLRSVQITLKTIFVVILLSHYHKQEPQVYLCNDNTAETVCFYCNKFLSTLNCS